MKNEKIINGRSLALVKLYSKKTHVQTEYLSNSIFARRPLRRRAYLKMKWHTRIEVQYYSIPDSKTTCTFRKK